MTEPTEEQKTWIGKKFDQITGKDSNPKQLEHFFNTRQVYKVAPNNVYALKKALSKGPVGITVNAEGSNTWLFYSKGIIDNESCDPSINHAVIGVCYGVEPATDPSK